MWLESMLDDIRDPIKARNLCATRRSAGLPFLAQVCVAIAARV